MDAHGGLSNLLETIHCVAFCEFMTTNPPRHAQACIWWPKVCSSFITHTQCTPNKCCHHWKFTALSQIVFWLHTQFHLRVTVIVLWCLHSTRRSQIKITTSGLLFNSLLPRPPPQHTISTWRGCLISRWRWYIFKIKRRDLTNKLVHISPYTVPWVNNHLEQCKTTARQALF